MFCFSQCYTNARITRERLKRANFFFLYYYYSLKEKKNHAYLSQGCPGWKNRQEPQIPDQTLFHTMPPEWKEPRPGRDSPLSGTSPDVCGQTGLASQDVRAANCCSRYWVFTHSQAGCFALQVIKQGNGADVYESDPCAAAPRFCTSTSAPAAPSTKHSLLLLLLPLLTPGPKTKTNPPGNICCYSLSPPPPVYKGLNYLLCSAHLDFS